MALGDNDQILDTGINQGIGNSGLVSQSIQRANIEDNHNLRQALATSQATMQNEADQRLAEARNEAVKMNMQNVLAAGARQGSAGSIGGGRGLSAVVMYSNNFSNTFDTASAAAGRVQRGFSLTIPTADGSTIPKFFNSTDELKAYIQSNPALQGVNLVMPGVPDGVSVDEMKGLQSLGVEHVTPDVASQLSGIHPRKLMDSNAVSTSRGSRNARFDAETQKHLDQVASGGKIDWTKLPSYAQAQILGSGMEQVSTLAKQIRTPMNVQDFNSMGESEQILTAIAREKDLSRRAEMTKYAIENGIISPRRRGY